MSTFRTTTITAPTPSRRAVLRTAAWTVPVISVAATAPAFAASTMSGLTFEGVPVKWGTSQPKHVSWDLRLVTGPQAVKRVVITFSYVPSGNGGFDASTFVVQSYGGTVSTWTKSPTTGSTSTITATSTDVAASTTNLLHVDFSGSDNSSGYVSATAVVTYADDTTSTLTTGNVYWTAGSEHSH